MICVRLIIAVVAIGIAPAAHAGDCPSQPQFELPVVKNDLGSPLVPILIDDKPRDVLLDTGGFWSMLAPKVAKLYGERKSPIVGQLGLEGLKLDHVVRVPSVQIGPMRVADVDFYAEPDEYTDAAATLGANWLARFDVEIDPLSERVRFFAKGSCGDAAVRWPHSDFAEVPVKIDRLERRVTVPLVLDGKEIRALIDTGAAETFLSLRVAEALFGLTPASPGMKAVEPDTDLLGRPRQIYRYQFQRLAMGGIDFGNPWLVLAPMNAGGPDMILGMHHLRGLHLYFAYGEGKLYATTARGDILARQKQGAAAVASLPRDPVDLTNARNQLAIAAEALKRNDRAGAMAEIEQAVRTDPDYAPAYLARAELLTVIGQHDRAIADLTLAASLNPKDPTAFLERSRLYAFSGAADQALADANQAIRLDMAADLPYTVRAEAYAATGSWDRAMQDAAAAIRIDPRSLGGYLTRSHIYGLTGDYRHAFADADRAVHLQPKSAAALNARCWNGAILARLDDALHDCDAALAIRPYGAEIWDSRAFVHLKAGRLEPALADYNAALAIDPGFASSLYGRGMVKLKQGDRTGGAVDIAAARKGDPEIAAHFGR